MRALTSLDTFFLAVEDGRTILNVSSLAILDRFDADGNTLTLKGVQDMIAERLHLLPTFRWQLANVPLDLGHPWWVEGDVDLDFHVRELSLVAPADRAALETQVARLAAHPMDRSRPLWEVYLIHGLQNNQVGLLTKMHHAAVDGVSGAEVMGVLLDGSPDGREIPPAPRYRAERTPSQLGMLARAVGDMPRQPLRMAKAARRTLLNLDQVATLRSVPGIATVGRRVRSAVRIPMRDGAVLEPPAVTAPRLRFNGKITPHRQLALTTLSLDEMKQIKRRFDATVNDVVVAVCAGALRRWLADRDELPDEPLVAAVPVSVRTAEQRGTFGNAVGTMVVPIPTDEADPVLRLRRCQQELRAAKERHGAVPASLMRDANDLVPPVLFGRAMRAVTTIASMRALAPAANVVISNVPGSPSPLYCAGHLVLEHYPVSTISDSLGLNVTIFSYRDRLDIGVVGDREIVDDLHGLAEAFSTELDLLSAARSTTSLKARSAAPRKARTKGRAQ
jgi:diacylglycerol O-acyltransferase / wax synthase